MSVRFYGKGEHPAGFVGFRVARTVGSENKYKQKYFSLNAYSLEEAEALAYELDALWKTHSSNYLREQRIWRLTRPGKVSRIAEGFYLMVDYGLTKKSRYLEPVIVVGRRDDTEFDVKFRVKALGYDATYQSAAKLFSETHELTHDEHKEILSRQPPISVFTNYLGGKLADEFPEWKQQLAQKLNIDSATINTREMQELTKVGNQINENKLPFNLLYDRIITWHRSSAGELLIKRFYFEEWGGLSSAYEAALSHDNQINQALKIKKELSREVVPEYTVRAYKQSRKDVFSSHLRAKQLKSFTCAQNDTADGSFHAYRTALAYNAAHERGENLDAFKNWKQVRLYTVPPEPLPDDFWLAESKKLTEKEKLDAIQKLRQRMRDEGIAPTDLVKAHS